MTRPSVLAAIALTITVCACSGPTTDPTLASDSGTTAATSPSTTAAGDPDVATPSLPATVGGEDMSIVEQSGGELVAGDGWAEYFDGLGVQADEFHISSITPMTDSGMDISAVALTAPVDWQSALDMLAQSIEDTPGYEMDQVPLGDGTVWHVTAPSEPDMSAYYLASGDTLIVIDTPSEDLVSSILEEATSVSASSTESPPKPMDVSLESHEQAVSLAADDAGDLQVLTVRQPLPPVCVAEPFGRQQLMFMITHLRSGVPIPAITSLALISAGEVSPALEVANVLPVFQYKANLFIETEHIQMQATNPWGGVGFGAADFPVQHCLNGLWDDAGLVVKVNQSGIVVTTVIESGSLCGEELEDDFEGTITDDQLSGPRALFCNPIECVDAGVLPLTYYAPFTALVSPDGQLITGSWENQYYEFVYNDADQVVDCVPTETETDTFTLTRTTFGPEIP